MNYRNFFPLLLTAFAVLSTYSTGTLADETTPGEKWSLDRIIARAQERTPEVKALAKDIERAENLAHQAGKWENPEGAVSYGPMTQAGLSGYSFDVSLKQSIPLFGQKA